MVNPAKTTNLQKPRKATKTPKNPKYSKPSVQDKYRAIAYEYIIGGCINFPAIYAKYYPDCKQECIMPCASRLLTTANFVLAKEYVWSEINIDKIDLTQKVIKGLMSESENALRSSDRIRAYELLGKTLALFKDTLHIEGKLDTREALLIIHREAQKKLSRPLNRIVPIIEKSI